MHHGFTWTAAILVAAASAPAIAATLADEVRALDDGWAQVAFGTQAPAGKAASLERLARVAAGIAARHPDRAEPLLWQGILAGEQAAALVG